MRRSWFQSKLSTSPSIPLLLKKVSCSCGRKEETNRQTKENFRKKIKRAPGCFRRLVGRYVGRLSFLCPAALETAAVAHDKYTIQDTTCASSKIVAVATTNVANERRKQSPRERMKKRRKKQEPKWTRQTTGQTDRTPHHIYALPSFVVDPWHTQTRPCTPNHLPYNMRHLLTISLKSSTGPPNLSAFPLSRVPSPLLRRVVGAAHALPRPSCAAPCSPAPPAAGGVALTAAAPLRPRLPTLGAVVVVVVLVEVPPGYGTEFCGVAGLGPCPRAN